MSKPYLQHEEEQVLIRLPMELIKDIIERLSGKDLANLASVCSLLDRIICNDNALWKRKFRQEEFEYMPGEIYSCKAWRQRFAATWIMYKRKANRKLAVGSDYVAKRSKKMYWTLDDFR